MTAYDPRCECESCMSARYARFGQILNTALQFDAPENLVPKLSGLRPITESRRRALLGGDAAELKVHSGGNANRQL